MAEQYKGMYTLDWGDVVNGKMGTAWIQYKGQNIPAGWLKKIEMKMDKDKARMNVLGRPLSLHRVISAEITGSATLYYCTSLFRQIASSFANDGKDIYFDLVVENDDPTSVLGAQAIKFINCNADSTILAKVDVDGEDPLDEDLDLTAEGFELLSSFSHPQVPISLDL